MPILNRRTVLKGLAASAAIPSIAKAQTVPPNIIMILTDDQDMDSLQYMSKLMARNDLVHFPNAFLETSLCAPSRATLFTGLYDVHHGVTDNIGNSAFNASDTIATLLKGAGYSTHFFGKYLNGYPWNNNFATPAGWDDWHVFKGNPAYFNYHLIENGMDVLYGGTSTSAPQNYSTDVLCQMAVNTIASPPANPYLIWLAPFAPHKPCTPAPRYKNAISVSAAIEHPNFNAIAANAPAWQQALLPLDAHTMDVEQVNSWKTMLAVDEWIDTIFTTLANTGQLSNTVVIIMTDNGISLGRHRWEEKRTEYDESGVTPLFIRMPDGHFDVVTALMSNVDIYPTIADLAGVSYTPRDGLSLAPWLNQTPPPTWRDAVLRHWVGGNASGKNTGLVVPSYWALRTLTENYVEIGDGEVEYYDHTNDPWEINNRASDPAVASRTAALHSELAAMVAAL